MCHVHHAVIEMGLELEDGMLTYGFDILSPKGRLCEVEVAASTGEILEIEEEDDDNDQEPAIWRRR